MSRWKRVWSLLKGTFSEFGRADCTNLAASLSYFTIFSLAPMLIVVIAVSGMVLGKDAAAGVLYEEIRGLVGDDSARMIQTMIENAYRPGASLWATGIGLLTLLVGSTGVFINIQGALNKVWGAHPEKGGKGWWKKLIRNRFVSFAMLLCIGFLLLVSLAVNALLVAFWEYLLGFLPDFSAFLLKGAEVLASLALTTALFTLMYKIFPDAKPRWRDAARGGLLTAVFFDFGKNLIGLYLGRGSVASTYGAAGALVVLLLWIHYSALILFFGACFIKSVQAQRDGREKA